MVLLIFQRQFLSAIHRSTYVSRIIQPFEGIHIDNKRDGFYMLQTCRGGARIITHELSLLECNGNAITSMTLVQWPLMGGLLHLV